MATTRGAAALTAVLACACGGENGDSGGLDAGSRSDTGTRRDAGPQWDGGTGETDEMEVGPEGGTVTLFRGDVTLDVPPGAVLAPTTISAERFNPPDGLGFVTGAAYDFGPDGAQFQRPLTVSFRVDPSAVRDVEDFAVAKLVGRGVELQPTLPYDAEAGVLRGQLSSFSPYGPIDEQAGCSPGNPPYFTASVNPNRGGVTLRWSGRSIANQRLVFERAVVRGGGACSCAAPRARGCVDDPTTPGRCVFNGFQDPQPGDWEVLGEAALGAGEIDDRRATAAGAYNYRARTSFGGACRSAWSAPVRAVVFGPAERPDAPSNVRLQPLSCGGFSITWDGVSNAMQYEVQRRRVQVPESFETVATLRAYDTAYVDASPDLEPGTAYRYRVIAVGSGGQTPSSVVDGANADTPFSIGVTPRSVRVAPGERVDLGVHIQRHDLRRFDVELDFETTAPAGVTAAQAGVAPTFLSRVTDLNESTLRFDVDPATSTGVVVEGRVVATSTVSAETCTSAPVRIEVGEPYCQVHLPNVVVEPGEQTTVDFTIDRGGFGGLMDVALENVDDELPLAELGLFASIIPNPTETRGSVLIDTGDLPFPNYQGAVRMTATSQTDPSLTCEVYADLEIDGGGQTGGMCSDPLSVEIMAAEDHCETTFEWDGQTYPAYEFDRETTRIYLYPETSRPVSVTEWDLAVQDPTAPNYVEEVRFGQEVELLQDTARGVAVRVTDWSCEPDAVAEQVLVLVSGDGVCD
jgi:hypothetical protein